MLLFSVAICLIGWQGVVLPVEGGCVRRSSPTQSVPEQVSSEAASSTSTVPTFIPAIALAQEPTSTSRIGQFKPAVATPTNVANTSIITWGQQDPLASVCHFSGTGDPLTDSPGHFTGGDLTAYDSTVGPGSCGFIPEAGSLSAAVSHCLWYRFLGSESNANHNSICKRTLQLTGKEALR